MRRLSVLGLLGLLTALIGSRPAFATTTPHHASECFVANGGIIANNSGQLASTGLTTGAVWCPITYDEGASPTKVTISGFSNGCPGGSSAYGLTVNVCVAPAAGGAQVCNASASIPSGGCTAGVYQISANVPTMSSGDYVYANVAFGIPSGSGGGASYNSFFGYQVQH
jgi:hypothetical protein